MVGFLKSLQSVLSGVLADLPDSVKVVTEFLYRVRWFLVSGVVLFGLYQLVMVVLPYLMWMMLTKMVLGFLSSVL
jgi:hypothetical protein